MSPPFTVWTANQLRSNSEVVARSLNRETQVEHGGFLIRISITSQRVSSDYSLIRYHLTKREWQWVLINITSGAKQKERPDCVDKVCCRISMGSIAITTRWHPHGRGATSTPLPYQTSNLRQSPNSMPTALPAITPTRSQRRLGVRLQRIQATTSSKEGRPLLHRTGLRHPTPGHSRCNAWSIRNVHNSNRLAIPTAPWVPALPYPSHSGSSRRKRVPATANLLPLPTYPPQGSRTRIGLHNGSTSGYCP
jgi:hypothetical protein